VEIPFECVERARAGEFRVFTCPELLEQLAEKLGTRLHFSADQVAETVADYLGFLRVIQIPKALTSVSRDPDDNRVLECALEGHAQHVVSGDKELLELKEFRGIRIVRAAEFLSLLAHH
jgi:putative PIN family toxin of toxin-antitoxin system